jgi:DNA-binding response OmpR family regulator
MIAAMTVTVPTVLVVDDDPDVLLMLRVQLEVDGFRVVTAEQGHRALQLVQRRLPHAAILDLMMPGMDGFTVARRLRQQQADLPIIMLTAIDEEERKVEGLQHFADDYVTKPFSYRELLARLRNLLARAWPGGEPAESVAIDDRLTLRLAEHLVVTPAGERRLTPMEARLLLLLFRNRGQVLPNDLLLARLWPDGDSGINSLWEYVRRLREKLGDTIGEQRYIESVRGIGYRFLGRS